ncbi:MAG: hypothetical protein DLM60_15325 [Pseudonocardiales bacterium]|nr:MAG: hypothetical protein DLM60_15325 [Pseudonocardiales bacterium]
MARPRPKQRRNPFPRGVPSALPLAFPVQRVGIEVGGWAWHMTADRFVANRRRQNALVNARWTVLRFTWHDLDARPDDVLNKIAWPAPSHDHCFGRINRDERGSSFRNSDHWSGRYCGWATGGAQPARG